MLTLHALCQMLVKPRSALLRTVQLFWCSGCFIQRLDDCRLCNETETSGFLRINTSESYRPGKTGPSRKGGKFCKSADEGRSGAGGKAGWRVYCGGLGRGEVATLGTGGHGTSPGMRGLRPFSPSIL